MDAVIQQRVSGGPGGYKLLRSFAHTLAFHSVTASERSKVFENRPQERKIDRCIGPEIVRMPPQMVKQPFFGRVAQIPLDSTQPK